MGSIRCIFTVILLSFMIFGCATPQSVSQEKLTGIKRIATISLLGDKIELKHIGSTVFTNKATYEPVNWKIDTLIKNTINNEISKRTNFQIVDIDFNRDNLTAQEIKNAYDAENQLPKVGVAAKDIEQYLRKIKASRNIDTLILVTRSYCEVPGTYQRVQGYSLRTRKALFVLDVTPELSLFSVIKVIDLNTMEEIAKDAIFKHKAVGKEYSIKTFSELSAPELKVLEDFFRETILEEIPLSLQELKLIPIDYSDGINKVEASILAEEYLVKNLSNTCILTKPFDGGDTWKFAIMKCVKDEAVAIEEIPPIIVDKKTGKIIWNYRKL